MTDKAKPWRVSEDCHELKVVSPELLFSFRIFVGKSKIVTVWREGFAEGGSPAIAESLRF
jgi:hypothetical protein